MKVLKKVLLTFLLVLVLLSVGGYVYFEQKFTPEKNYLIVENESGEIPFTWLGKEKNVLLLPINFSGDEQTYYMQFDTGSPFTILYSESIKNIKEIMVKNDRAKTSFNIGKTKIISDNFKIYNQNQIDEKKDTLKIIGTIGADILESRKTIINFKENHLVFNVLKIPTKFQNNLFDFKFKKRKIIINGSLNGKKETFLFDSGTSAYELLTNKEVWKDLKSNNSKVIIEKSQSWQNVLTTYTANCNQKIKFNNRVLSLNNVTYVEGFSQTQYLLMKFSGMTGMLGNKIFLKNSLYIDCTENKIGIE